MTEAAKAKTKTTRAKKAPLKVVEGGKPVKKKTTKKKVTTKTTAKKTTTKAVAKTPATAPAPAEVGMIDAEKLRDAARVAYGNFQKSWYEFAKIITDIYEKEVWTNLGHETFKHYCLEEFRDIGYPTIVKFMQVINSWGDAIENRLKKDPKQLLPSYETCYTLTAAADKLPKAEVPKLRKQILDGKVTVRDMRERVAEAKGTTDKREEDAAAKKIQKDIDDAAPLTVKLAEGKGIDDACELIDGKVQFLIDNIALLTKAVNEPTEALVNLATKIQDTLIEETLNPFLDKVADIAGEEEEEGEED